MSSTPQRVLIVEDDDGVRQALERGLARGGFDTVPAAVAADALCTEFDIALVDLGLPDRDGIELCRELRIRFPERPIIVVTGRNDELDVIELSTRVPMTTSPSQAASSSTRSSSAICLPFQR